MQRPTITVIIPTYNEANFILNCLQSLNNQTSTVFDVIVVDDGSTDRTGALVKPLRDTKFNFILHYLHQVHSGPGVARNLAANKANGDVLVFIDADMTFDNNFIEMVTNPIVHGLAKGTDSQAGILGNPDNYWARCWNMGKFAAANNYSKKYLSDITPNKKDYGGIFRAILKSEFQIVGGFDTDGDYTDDSSLGRKLGYKAKIVTKGKFYHWNPDQASEVWMRASWIGAGKYFTSTPKRIFINLLRFFPLVSMPKGLFIGLMFHYPQFVLFKLVYDTSIWLSVLKKL